MATTRTVRAEQPGPVTVRSKTHMLDVRVVVESGREYGEIIVSTDDDEGQSADIVKAALLAAAGKQISVEIHEGSGGITIVQSGRGGRTTMVNTGGGMFIGGGRMVVGDNVTVVNGRVVSGNATVIEAGSPITVTAYVPEGSSVSGSSQSGDLEAVGRYAQVSFASQSGDAEVDEAGNANIQTQSGDITIDRLTGTAVLNSMSGDISVHGPSTASATARTMSGDVRGSGGIALDASTIAAVNGQRLNRAQDAED